MLTYLAMDMKWGESYWNQLGPSRRGGGEGDDVVF